MRFLPEGTIRNVSDCMPFKSTLERAKQGNSEAIEALARRFYPAVQGLVHHRLASDLRQNRPWLSARFSTGDVVQTVFEGVLRDLGAFAGESEEAFIGYLAAVVRNRIIDAIRFHEAAQRDGRRMKSIAEDFDTAGPGPDPSATAMAAERIAHLILAISLFEPREQHLLRARMEELASFKELAEQLGYGSESAARRAFFDAQATLALRMKGHR